MVLCQCGALLMALELVATTPKQAPVYMHPTLNNHKSVSPGRRRPIGFFRCPSCPDVDFLHNNSRFGHLFQRRQGRDQEQPAIFERGHSEKPCRSLNQAFNVRMVPQDRHELAGAVIQPVFNDPHEALVEKKGQLVVAIE